LTAPPLARYLAGRCATFGGVLAVGVVINFALPRALPGGPLSQVASPEVLAQLTAIQREQIAAQYGFDKPLREQFLSYLGGVLRGDLGNSFVDGEPVLSAILRVLPWTLLLVGTAIVLTIVIGVGLGVLAALRRRRGKGSGLLITAVVLDSLPQFWLGMLLIVLFGVHLGVLPTFGVARGQDVSILDVVEHLVLPVTTLVATGLGSYLLYVRYSLLAVLTSEPVEHARARGVPPRRVVSRHALRPALLPVHTLLMLEIGFLTGGALVVETVFAYPGLGRLAFDAIRSRDYPMMQGTFLILTVMVVLMNAIADATYPLIDPRARTRAVQ
jgi:peptide/nickel transport system permease protein